MHASWPILSRARVRARRVLRASSRRKACCQPALHLSPAIQPQLPLRRCAQAGAVSPAAGRQPLLCLAASEGARRAASTATTSSTTTSSIPRSEPKRSSGSFVSELKAHGMGLILDIVPNHMGVGHGTNPWWQDVLQNGRASAYADFFDIDWEPLKAELRNKVLTPDTREALRRRSGAGQHQGGLRRRPLRREVLRQGAARRSADHSR